MKRSTSPSPLLKFLYDRLKTSELWSETVSENGNTIQGLICPECNQPGAWANLIDDSGNGPYALICNDEDKCGSITRTIELFDVHDNIESEFKPTKSDPNLPARIYLESIGLKNSLNGLDFEYMIRARGINAEAVMFPIGIDEKGKQLLSGRRISSKRGDATNQNIGSASGLFWKHPGHQYDPFMSIFITEDIIEALSLWEMGVQAIAVSSTEQHPTEIDLSDFDKVVLAFGSDCAGSQATKRWKKCFPEATAVVPDKGIKWNDILLNGSTNKAGERFRGGYERFETNARLVLADSAKEYAEIYRCFWKRVPGIFEFDENTYLSEIKKKREENYVAIERCGKFTLQVISFYKDTSNPYQPEYRYYLKVTPKAGAPIYAVANGKELATTRGMKEFFLSRAKVSFEGGSASCTALATKITCAPGVPEVDQLSLTGYDIKSDWYIYKHYAIDREGKLHLPDSRGFYKLNNREWCNPPPHSSNKSIKPADTGRSVREIHYLITDGWGNNGAVAFAWTVSGWFVNQIKKQIGFFPFLSLYGDPGSGKSGLAVMLNATQGIDGEGLPLSQLNTKKALARSISRVSGMFTALLEDNQRNERSFDYSILLTAYNQGPLQLRAILSNDYQTTESPFQGSIMFVQNTEPFIQKAEKQRVISLSFKHSTLNNYTLSAYEELMRIPLPELSRTMISILQKRMKFENNWFLEYQSAIDEIGAVENRRILQNHALILGFHRLLCREFEIDYDILDFLRKTAEEKCITSSLRTYTPADHFFETVDLLSDDKTKNCVKYDEESGLIYINLPGVEKVIRENGIQFYVNPTLTDSLIKHPAFVESGKQIRFHDGTEVDQQRRPKQRRVWVFNAKQIGV